MRRITRRAALAVLSVLVSAASLATASGPAQADAGLAPDLEFGDAGIAVLPGTEDFDWGWAATTDHLGRVLVSYHHFPDVDEPVHRVARLLPDGTLDESFGDGGFAALPMILAEQIAATTDGIAIAGLQERDDVEDDHATTVLRLHDDGSLDTRFDGDGIAVYDEVPIADASIGVALGPGGAMTVAAALEADHGGRLLRRYRPDGALDPTFGTGGAADVDAAYLYRIEVDASGRTYGLAGRGEPGSGGLVRVTAAGGLDPTYGVGGWSAPRPAGPPSAGGHFDIAPDGSALLAGGTAVWRLDPSGHPDRRFGDGGIVVPGPEAVSPAEATLLRSGHVAVRSRDGRVAVLGPTGTQLAEAELGAGMEPLVLGAAIWATPTGFLTVSGTDPSNDPGRIHLHAFATDLPALGPVVTATEVHDGSVSVTWAPPSEELGAPVRAYLVTARDLWTGGVTQRAVAADVRQVSLPGLDTGVDLIVTPGLPEPLPTYEVTVLPFDELGATVPSEPVVVDAAVPDPTAVEPASAVTELSAMVAKGSATATWAPPADDGGAPILGYAVLARRAHDDKLVAWRNVPADARTVSLPGLADLVPHEVLVVAHTSVGFGAAADPVTVTPTTDSPARQGPAVSWASVAPLPAAKAIVTWGPPVERGDSATRTHVIVTKGGAFLSWRVVPPTQRQLVVASPAGSQVHVITESASGWGPVTTVAVGS